MILRNFPKKQQSAASVEGCQKILVYFFAKLCYNTYQCVSEEQTEARKSLTSNHDYSYITCGRYTSPTAIQGLRTGERLHVLLCPISIK